MSERTLSRLGPLTESFLEVENRLGLLEVEVRGVHLWKRMRFHVHKALLQELGVMGGAGAGSASNRLVRIAREARGALRPGRRLAPAELLLVTDGRRARVGDEWWDLHCDPLAPHLPGRSLTAEFPFQGRHFGPPAVGPVAHLDGLALAAGVTAHTARALPLRGSEKEILRDVGAALSRELGSAFDPMPMARRVLLGRSVARRLWARVLDRVRPRVVLLVCSYGKEELIRECHHRSIPTIELQHGVISPYHMGYHFPEGLPAGARHDFPDHFFAWGDYWTGAARFPLPPDRLHVVGFPFFERFVREGAEPGSGGDEVLFVSQETIGGELSRFAAATGSALPERDVVYRLHPRERHDWKSRYPWLVDAPIRIDMAERPLVEALLAAGTQVGVYSTAIFEGLGLGLRTALVDLPGIEYMAPLIDGGRATRVRSPADLAAFLEDPPPADRTRAFAREMFAPDPGPTAGTLVAAILGSGSRWPERQAP